MQKAIFIFLLSFLCVFAKATGREAATNELMKGYILDGQQHKIKISEGNSGKAYFTFFEGFNYRVVFGSNAVKDFKISLYDIEKNLIYSKVCNDYLTFIDLKFQANIAGYLMVEVYDIKQNIDTFTFDLTIGIKEDKAKK
jgi:hypothetical protein